MDSHRGFYKGTSASIGKISMEFKEDEKESEKDSKIDAIINESSWVKKEEAPAAKAAAKPSFMDLVAEEQTKKKQKKSVKTTPQQPAAVDPRAIERPVYSNKPIRAQEAYRDDEPEYGEMVYNGETGETTFVPYPKEQSFEESLQEMGYSPEEIAEHTGSGPRNDRRNYGGRGNYGRSGYDNDRYRGNRYGGNSGRYGGRNSYSNQFYDNGEDDEAPAQRYERGGRRNDYYDNSAPVIHLGGKAQGGYREKRGGYENKRQPKLSAKEKYGDYSKKKTQPELEEPATESAVPKYVPKFQFGSKQAPPPPPPQVKSEPAPVDPVKESQALFNPKKVNQVEEKEEDWNPEE